MKPTVFRYGIYTTLVILGLGAIHFFFIMPPAVSWATAEIAGFLTMILSMVFVFAGIRYYRDHVNGGMLSFGQGMKVGILIVLMPAVLFGLFDILYTEVLDPSWADKYYGYQAEKIKKTAPAELVAERLQNLQKNKEQFGNPAFQFMVMAGTVLVIGLIVTIISVLTLRKSKPVTA